MRVDIECRWKIMMLAQGVRIIVMVSSEVMYRDVQNCHSQSGQNNQQKQNHQDHDQDEYAVR
jgi:hypothetical protein